MIPVGDLANAPVLRDLPPADGPTFLAPIRGFFHTLSVLFEQVIRPASRNVSQRLDNDYQFLVDMYDLGVRRDASETPSSLPTCPNAESITSSDAQKFKKAASRTEWGQQAEAIVVNRDSWTMSVYFPLETTDDIDIPLTFNGLPVIPHGINHPHNPTEAPKLLTGASSTKISTRLCQEHINSLKRFFRGLVSIDLFRDGVVYLYFRRDDYWDALAKFPDGNFKAWGAVFIIVQLVARLGRDCPARIYPGPVSELYPGSRVRNSVGHESTLGTFLRKACEEILPDSQLGADLITVSAHSFVRRRFLRFDDTTICHFAVAIISIACLWNNCRSLISWNYDFLIHFLAIKTIMTMCDARWMRAHRSTNTEKSDILFERKAALLTIDFLFSVPLIARALIPATAMKTGWAVEITLTVVLAIFCQASCGQSLEDSIYEVGEPETGQIFSRLLHNILSAEIQDKHRVSKLTYPFRLLLITPSLSRLCLPRLPPSIHRLGEFVATACMLWDIAEALWFFPLPVITAYCNPLYYYVVGEDVYFKRQKESAIIAKITRAFDYKQDKINMHNWSADICVAELTHAKSLPACTSLGWDTAFPGWTDKINLLGTQETGTATGLDERGKPTMNPISCMMGGMRYRMSSTVEKTEPTYYDCPLLWRSPRRTVVGFSGAALVRRTTTGGFNVVGFQSHEVVAMTNAPHGWWKIAFVPPRRLQQEYIAICPPHILEENHLENNDCKTNGGSVEKGNEVAGCV